MKIQQGDVVLKTITEEEFFKEQTRDYRSWNPLHMESNTDKNDKCTLALGEHTGHHHRFEKDKMNGFKAEAWTLKNNPVNEPVFLIVSVDKNLLQGDYPKLYHEEHNPIEVPPGYYKKTIVREFDHLMQDTRAVWD